MGTRTADSAVPGGIVALVLVATAGLGLAVALAATGSVAATQHDVDVSFSDETAGPGDTVTVDLMIDPASAPGADVASYDIEVDYDDSVLSVVDVSGNEMTDPIWTEPSAGTIQMTATQASGESLPTTPATITFEVEENPIGSSGSVYLNDARSSFTDSNDDAVTFLSTGGSVDVEPHVDLSFSDESAAAGQTVDVDFLIDPATASNADVSSYDIEVTYDESVLSTVDVSGADMTDPNWFEPSTGTIQMTASQASGEAVPLTAATVTFEIDGSAAGGETGTVQVEGATSSVTDDDSNPLLYESRAGTVTVTPDIEASFGDELAPAGETVDVNLDLDPAGLPDARVASYNVNVSYDDSVLSFVGASGADLSAPAATEPVAGTILLQAGQSTNETVPLTAADLTFQVDGSAKVGDVGSIQLVDQDSQFTDANLQTRSFESSAGSVTAAGPDPLSQQWDAQLEGRSQFATPAVTSDLVVAGGLGSNLSGLYRANGTAAWSVDRAGSLSDSSPTVESGTAYVGSGGGTVYAIDVADGSVEWTHETDSAIVSSPTVDSGTVYVGSNDGTVWALSTADGSVEWQHGLDAAVYTRPATDGQHVYVTTRAGDLVALDRAGSGEEWRFDAGESLERSAPAVKSGTVYVAADEVYAIDAASGDKSWQTSGFGGTVTSSPVVDGDDVYVGSADGQVYAIDAVTQSVNWSTAVGGEVRSTPAVVGDRVLVSSWDGAIHALDTAGNTLESASLPANTRSSPTADGDVVYVGTEAGTILALDGIPDVTASASSTVAARPVMDSSPDREVIDIPNVEPVIRSFVGS